MTPTIHSATIRNSGISMRQDRFSSMKLTDFIFICVFHVNKGITEMLWLQIGLSVEIFHWNHAVRMSSVDGKRRKWQKKKMQEISMVVYVASSCFSCLPMHNKIAPFGFNPLISFCKFFGVSEHKSDVWFLLVNLGIWTNDNSPDTDTRFCWCRCCCCCFQCEWLFCSSIEIHLILINSKGNADDIDEFHHIFHKWFIEANKMTWH